MKNFTAVPNQLLRTGQTLRANERLFLIYLLSHKKGYSVTDVQACDNTGISRSTVPKLREKLREKGYIIYQEGKRGGMVYEVIMDSLNNSTIVYEQPCADYENIKEDIIRAFKTGLTMFKEHELYKKIIDKEYIKAKWHLSEYNPSPGDIKNITYFIKNRSKDEITQIIDKFEKELHNYLINKILDYDFYEYNSEKEITPTISFFLRSKSAYSELIGY